ncbi:MAG TPA: hypothetical protein VIX80_04630 [Candidatus Kapabacteria bacterium]
MNKICFVVIALFFVSMISSCDSGETSPSTTTAGQDSVFYTVDGVAYKQKLNNTFKVNDSLYMFGPSDDVSDRVLELLFSNAALGKFSTKGSTPGLYFIYYPNRSSVYSANTESQDSVTVFITELTPNFKATFHGTFNKNHSSIPGPPTITITDGSINAKIN